MFDSHIRIFKNSAITSKIWHYLSSNAQNKTAEYPVHYVGWLVRRECSEEQNSTLVQWKISFD